MYDNDEPVGAARLRSIDNNTAKIERVCILQSQRGKKLGALIMKEMEKHAISINKNLKTSCTKLCNSLLRKARLYSYLT